jgi:uncharacterized membrane protein YphA (DoxX/SURF4 family)
MVWVTGPFAITAAVLLAGGALKARDSGPTHDALRALRVPAPGAVARVSGPLELVVGGLALLVGGWVAAAAVTAAYLVFVAVLSVQLSDGADGSCGCFGRLSSRPSPVHLVTNAALALVAVTAVVTDPPGLLATVGQADPVVDGIVLAALVVLAAALVVAVLTVLPAAGEATRADGTDAGAVRTFALTGTSS